MKRLQLLDCTLRDGGHINNGKFGEKIISAIIQNLVSAKIDIIEAGFLVNSKTDINTARYQSIGELKNYLPSYMGCSKISLMADNADLSELEPYDGTVEYIRLSFRKNEFAWAEKTMIDLREKGYKCFINPIHGSSFTDQEYLDIINRVNQLRPYGFSIVDTFGALKQVDLGRIYYLIEHNLDKGITLGIHLHENLGQAYSLAQYLLSIAFPTRNIVIDGSLYGMGKVPGNLCIEQIIDTLNSGYNMTYSTEPLYDAIDEYIMPIYKQTKWGYSIPYALSAQCSVHRTYAEYLVAKERLRTKDLRRILKSIKKDKAEIFDEEYIEILYQNYMDGDYKDKSLLNRVITELNKFEEIVIIAPGKSIRNYKFEKQLLEHACVITVNFLYEGYEANYYFFSNSKRLGTITKINEEKLIVTSNLLADVEKPKYIIPRNELVYHDDVFCDDSTLMLLNLLKMCNQHKIYIAGFDGFGKNKKNFYSSIMEKCVRESDYHQEKRMKILKSTYAMLDIAFLTHSLYEKAFE